MKSKLTERQFQMAELYLWAGRKKVVAQALGVAVYTVDNTLREVYRKLDIYPEELAAYYMLHHLGVKAEQSPIERYPDIVSGCTWGLDRKGILNSIVGLVLLFIFSNQIIKSADLFQRPQNGRIQNAAKATRLRTRKTEINFMDYE